MIKKDFNQLQETWRNFGNVSPHWSVLTQEHYKPHHIQNSESRFYDTGKHDFNFFQSILNKHDRTFKDKVILDFGCGVGRLTKPCSEVSDKVYGMDSSEPHLQIARNTAPTANFFLVNGYKTLPKLPKNPNIIFSWMVLQHVRPKLIEVYVAHLLKILSHGGIALLHVPYDIQHYDVVTDQTGVLEMHYISKAEMRKIIRNLNCEVLEEVETNCCGKHVNDCMYVIKKANS